MKKNLLTRTVGQVLILRETADPPSDEEWDECLGQLAVFRDMSRVRVLVVTEGGGPSTTQRKRLSGVSDGQPVRVAVVTESMKVRFIVSSVALFLREISSFRQNEMALAFEHLGVTGHDRFLVERAIAEMNIAIQDRPRSPTAGSHAKR